ncbi:MAG: VTT domain-containing protein [Myxococcota bacterium]
MTRRRWAALGAAALLFGGALYARGQLGLAWDLEALRTFVEGLGAWAPIAFVLLVAFRLVVVVPSQLALIAGGICFGTVGGTLYGAIGLLVSALWVFTLTRWLGADSVRSRVPAGAQRALAAAGSRGGAALVAIGTGYPVGNITGYHAAAALTPMRIDVFALAVALGSLARAWTYAFFGNAILERSTVELLAIGIGVGIAAVVLPLLHPRVRLWARERWRELRSEPPA